MDAISKALSAFLRAFADGVDEGDIKLSNDNITRLLDVCADYDRKDDTQSENNKLIDALGRAYALLSERQDRIEEKLVNASERLKNRIESSNVLNVDFRDRK